MPGDWEYEEYEEAEPYEAEPYEAADEAADEAESEPEYDGEAAPYRRDFRRPLPMPFRGVQSVTLTTPRGPATIQLPSKVPTLAELNRVQSELVATKRRMSKLSIEMGRSRRRARSGARADDRGARNAILIVALEQVRDVLRDVGTYSLIRDTAAARGS